MSTASTNSNTLPPGPIIKPKLSRDDILMRGSMMVIVLYLIVTLALPLSVPIVTLETFRASSRPGPLKRYSVMAAPTAA